MTADVVDLHRQGMPREADRIAAARADAIASHPSSRSKQLAQVERQQVLGSLVAAIGDERLDPTSTSDLPLIVAALLLTCPQAAEDPKSVARGVYEAAEAHLRAGLTIRTCDDPSSEEEAAESAFLVSQLAAGRVCVPTWPAAMEACSALADWLETAVSHG